MDGQLRAALEDAGSEPFWYEKQGKTVIVNGYQSAPESALDDDAELLEWAGRALGAG